MDISVEMFNRICRTCLSESSDLKSLFTKLEGEERKLFDLFTFTANISFETEDMLPKQVCGDCEYSIQKADEFKKRCLQSQSILKKIVEPHESPVNFTDSDVKKDIQKHLLDISPDLDVKEGDNKVFSDISQSFNINCLNDLKPEEQVIKEELDIEFEEHYPNHDDDDYKPFPELNNEIIIKKIHTCVCNQQFTSKQSLKDHIKVFDCKTKKKKQVKALGIKIKTSLACHKCDLVFTNFPDYREHEKTHPETTPTVSTDEGPRFQCTKCFRKFKTKKLLNRHLKRHEHCDNVTHTCQKCKRDFKYAAHLKSHMASVHMINEIVCDICNEKFLTKTGLEAHREENHSKKKHLCHMCNKSFLMLCTLKDHIRSHTGEKPFLCSTCGKGFSQKTNLAQHTRRHMGLKPFKCDTCTKSFVSKGELEAHTRKHSGAHPFVCDDCGNGFTTSSALVKHKRIHTGERPYQCDLCPMKFAASGTLMNHRRTHTGERPYQCSYCEKAFVQRTDLVSHIRCHTGERPYVCTQCGQSFCKAATLKAHVKMHSKDPMLQGVNSLLVGNMNNQQINT